MERNVLRPVELEPDEAALVWSLIQAAQIPGAKVAAAARVLAKIEAATAAEHVPVTDLVHAHAGNGSESGYGEPV